MRRAAWSLIPVVLIVGAVGGYAARGKQTKTVTILQVQTVAPPPPGRHTLTAQIQGPAGECLAADGGSDKIGGDTFDLRRPGNGLTDGEVVGVSETQRMDETYCNLVVTFKIDPDLGFFNVNDDSQGVHWGPFDSRSLAERGWTIRLNYTTG